MTLSGLNLQGFRGYHKRQFRFSSFATILIGPNAVGKTNLLEAIYLLATGKSFRAQEEREVIRRGQELARVKGQVSFDREQTELEVLVTRGKVGEKSAPLKRFLVNGIPRRSLDFVGHLRVVLFWPQDLELVTNSPSLRRRYLDAVLVQTDREYHRSLLSYEKGLRQRNKLLERIRDQGANRRELLFWNQLVIKHGNYLTQSRQTYIDYINHLEKPFGTFKLVYDASFISPSRLEQYAEAEVATASTLVGPHRDDLQFYEKERDLAKFGSRGEQRLAILWLKLAELEYVAEVTRTRPLLLLDDIFSELDHRHREEIIRVVGKQQTIVTATDGHFLPKALIKQAEVVELGL